jgi:hypothetical protein
MEAAHMDDIPVLTSDVPQHSHLHNSVDSLHGFLLSDSRVSNIPANQSNLEVHSTGVSMG